MAAYSGII